MVGLNIRKAGTQDLTQLLVLFKDTIEAHCKNDYTHEQIQSWTSSSRDIRRWEEKIACQYFIVATIEDIVVGFASLEGDYLDFMYVHKDFIKKGIAHALFAVIENEARNKEVNILFVDASKTALAFFEIMGFTIKFYREKEMAGVSIGNYRMSKELG